MSAAVYLFLQTLWLQQILGATGAVLNAYFAFSVQRAGLRVLLLCGAALWFCVMVRAFIVWGLWMGTK